MPASIHPFADPFQALRHPADPILDAVTEIHCGRGRLMELAVSATDARDVRRVYNELENAIRDLQASQDTALARWQALTGLE